VLCIIGVDDNKVIKDFIRIHAESLPGDRICLSGCFPDYQYRGLNIRKQYEQPAWQRRLSSLLPWAFVSRRLARMSRDPRVVSRALGRFFHTNRVAAILAEFGTGGAEIAPVAAACGIPLVVHFHGHDAHRLPLFTQELLARYRTMFDTTAAVLGVSRYMCKRIAELGCDSSKLIYNPYGPRERFFDVRADYRKTVLSVGRFTDIKANYLVLMAFREAVSAVPDARLIMAGDGELLEMCRTLSVVWNISHAVEFLGPVEHARVHELFSGACCFAQHSVCPSYGDAEGTPNTILEASAAALPVIATRHAGIPDVVIDKVTGLLVDERDVQGMANAMIRVLSDPALARSLGEAGRHRVRKHFSSAAHIDRLNRTIQLARSRDAAGIAALAAESMRIGI
jgi:glycosyltransferase involved in cell wall biosynthesis